MLIAPSILDADFGHLQAELESLATANRIHLDVMDGHYVPSCTFGAAIFKKVQFPLPVEVHLMTENPSAFFADFLVMGVMGITFHIETVTQDEAISHLKTLKQANIKAGICIDGYTETSALSDDVLALADQVLIMSVKAGAGGQSFMPESLEKCRMFRERGFTGEIEFDGGVKNHNLADIKAAGADIVVVGSYLTQAPTDKRPSLISALQTI